MHSGTYLIDRAEQSDHCLKKMTIYDDLKISPSVDARIHVTVP